MDLGPLGTATSKQRVHRNLFDCVVNISNWGLLCLVVLICKKNPTRFLVSALTIAIYLVWMLIINRIDINQMERLHYLFLFDVSLFWTAIMVLLLPVLRALRGCIAWLATIGILFGIIGLHLLIYGKFWYWIFAPATMVTPIVALLAACKITELIMRKKRTIGKCTLAFVLSHLPALFISLAGCFVILYLIQIITEYDFRAHRIFYYEMKYVYLWFLTFYAAVIPFALFVRNNKFYRNILLNNPANTEGTQG